MYAGGCSLQAVILCGKRLLSAGSSALCGTACLLAFHGAGLRALRRTRPRALRKVRLLLVGTYANLVGLVGGQIFGGNGRNLTIFRNLNGVSAHGQRHVDRGGVLVKVIAKAGVLPLVAVFLIDRHAVAVGVVHLIPFCRHHLVADKFQLGPRGCGRLVGVRIVHLVLRLPAVNGHKGVFSGSALKGKVLFRH